MPVPSEKKLKAALSARIGAKNLNKLAKATVGFAGIGGIGSGAAVLLAKTGIGRFVIADKDIVELSNINRQAYSLSHIGLSKTEALKLIISDLNPYAQIDAFKGDITEKNVKNIFGDCDILIEGFDSPEAKAMLLQTFLKQCPRRPLISASGVVGFETCTVIKETKIGDFLYIIGDMESECSASLSLAAPRVTVSAGMMANLAVRLILKLQK